MKVCGANSQLRDLFIVSSESLYVFCYSTKGGMHLDVCIEIWLVTYKQNSQLKVTRVLVSQKFLSMRPNLRENGRDS